MKGLKFKIGLTFVLLLGAGMVLINIVLTMFWQRDMVRLEIDRFEMAMAISAENIRRTTANIESVIRRLAVHTGAKCALYQPAEKGPSVVSSGGCQYEGQLSKLARLAISSGKLQTKRAHSGVRSLSSPGQLTFIARPFDGNGLEPGAVALAVAMQPLAKKLIANQKAVFLYILINILILTVVGLARMAKMVIRPVERLAQMSETYTDDDGFNFLTIRGDDEFRRLSVSIDQMLKRIEADKNKLKISVQSLKEANQQLKDTQQEMVRSEKLASVGRLAAGLAHEIGNPVGIIQGYLDLIGQADVTASEKKDYLNRADKELQRIGGLIRRLLDFSRPGGQTPGHLSVHHLLKESIDMIKIRSEKETVTIEMEFKAVKETVFADPDQLRQVFLNCLFNAFDAVVARPKEDRRIIIATKSPDSSSDDQTGPWIEIRIRDNGTGIREADLPKVFDPFFTTKEPGKGTGLGLFVSHAIIENIGGRMVIGPAATAGSEVVIDLPLTEKEGSHRL